MRKRVSIILMILLANASLAWGQPAEEIPTLPRSLVPLLPEPEPRPDFPPPAGSPPRINDVPRFSDLPRYPSDPPARPEMPRPEGEGKKPEHEPSEHEEEEEEAKKAPSRFWVRGEYLFWFTKDANLPVLVTTGGASDPRPGALGNPNTAAEFGGGGQDFFNRSGARMFAGYWLDDGHCWGLEAGYFFVAGISTGQNFASPGNPVLSRPFFNTSAGNDAEVVAYPGVTNGNVLVTTGSFLQGAEMNMTMLLWKDKHWRMQGLVGFRYLNLNESVQINENDNIAVSAQYAGQPIPFAGDSINVMDSFTTRNDFYGGQIGIRTEYHYKRLSLEFLAKVAMGCTNEVVNIQGSTNINGTTFYNSGLLALSSNSGQFTRDAFSVVPEIGMNLSYQLTNHLRIFGGYSFLYWTNVVRPGGQIDTSVNPNLVPTSVTYGMPGGPARPSFSFHADDFFVHGANFGMEFTF